MADAPGGSFKQESTDQGITAQQSQQQPQQQSAQQSAQQKRLKIDARKRKRDIRNAPASDKDELTKQYREWFQQHEADLDARDADPMELDEPEHEDTPYGGADAGDGGGGHGGSEHIVESIEGNIDPNAPPIINGANGDSFTGNPLAGLPRVSVAKRQGKMRVPTYINKYGPEQAEWYTFGPLEGPDEGLEDKMRPINRRLSKQYTESHLEPKAKDFLNIIQVAFKYNIDEEFPLEACEALNPAEVKANKKTTKERKEWVRQNNNQRMKAFPPTMVLVQWVKHTPAWEPTWELASEVKALKNKSTYAMEELIYRVAKYRAKRLEPLIAHNRDQEREYSKDRLGTADAPRYESEVPTSQAPLPSIERIAPASPSPSPDPRPAGQERGPPRSAAANTAPQMLTPSPTPEPGASPPSSQDEEDRNAFIDAYCKEAKTTVDQLPKMKKIELLARWEVVKTML